MCETREIITLQFGNFANHVGCHFWNIQEHSFNYDPDSVEPSEIDHDVLFREGTFNRTTTFTPRMLLVDLKGTLKYIPGDGNLYTSQQLELNNPENSVLDQVRGSIQWDHNIEVMEAEEAAVPEYQKDLQNTNALAAGKDYSFKDTISNWPDFMYSRYHPKSINIVKEYEHHEELSGLDSFTSGMELWQCSTFEDDFTDNIRSFIEECNYCQGFQALFDVIDGFSGLTVKCLEYLEDEYSKSILAFPLFPPKAKNFQFADEAMSDSIRMINIAFSYAKLSEHSNLFTPLSTMAQGWRNIDKPRKFPFLSYEPTNLYHSSAILASFLDTMSLKYRLKGSASLSGLCSDLNVYNRKLTGAKLSFPFPMNEKEDFIDFLDRFEGDLIESLSPGTEIGTDRVIQSVTIRGIPPNRIKRPMESAKNQMKMAAYKCSSASEMIQLYYQCNMYASMSHVMSANSKMKIKSPFPKEFFDERLAKSGFLKEFMGADKIDVTELPVMSAIQNSGDLSSTLEKLHTNVSRIKIAKIPRFSDSLENIEYNELLEQLLVFKEQYDESFFL